MADVELTLPNLGEDAGAQATVNLWHKQEGDAIARDEDLLEVTYDKATFFVPSPVNGRLKEIVAREETEVPVGGLLAILQNDDA